MLFLLYGSFTIYYNINQSTDHNLEYDTDYNIEYNVN